MKKRKIMNKLVNIFIFISSIITIYLIVNIFSFGLIDRSVTVSVGNEFIDPGFKIYLPFIKSEYIKVSDSVDTNEIGKYKVNYKLNYLIFYKSLNRSVLVVDDESPELDLIGDLNISMCPLDEYDEEGYKALDNYDGDITDRVNIIKSKDKITYTVMDRSGNETSIDRILNRHDDSAPIIKLKGNNSVTINKGSKFVEPGYSAMDNCDGDITDKVIIESDLDNKKVGTYKITYKVLDSNDNETSITRTVKVKDNGTGGVIYLTFDDGPNANITPQILNILKEEGVLATFFIAQNSDSINYLIKREFDEGHTLALHTATHNYKLIYSSEEEYFKDLETIKSRVYNVTGYNSHYIRFPGGSSNTTSKFNPGIMTRLSELVTEKGYLYFDWNVSSGDAGTNVSSEQVYNNVINNLSRNRDNVVLLHDKAGNTYTVEALRSIIKSAKEQGYTFKAIDDNTSTAHHGIKN